jgi:hypothetical protein
MSPARREGLQPLALCPTSESQSENVIDIGCSPNHAALSARPRAQCTYRRQVVTGAWPIAC